MKVVRYHEKGPPEVLKIEEFPTPEPQAAEVLVKIEACGIPYGDVLRRSGKHYPIPVVLPHIPSGGVAGTVEKVGAGVDATLVGKRVYGQVTSGGYAEYGVS